MVNIGNRNKIKNSVICSGTLNLGNDKIIVNGKEIPKPPTGARNVSIINDRVFVDGYEYKNEKWEKTLSALFHKYF